MQESAQSAKISGTPPERGHSCPQQLPNTQQDRNVRELYYFRSTLLRTRMSALRFGSGSAGLDYYMRKSGQSAKISGTPPERGHSCPQQLPNTQQDRNVREL